ncbi:MAG TPA: hypothetical protein DCL15_17240 [Chloroflexi bacterium]|nr:hypothetical protein [Chloroflexota bacterium]HHW86763.1 SH3 domain-containing protein [Chloroflexota bacterium]
MQRKSLALVAIALTLLTVFMLQLTVAQAAAPQQAATPAADEPVTLAQPIRIRIRQALPLTITLTPATEMTATEMTATEMTATVALTDSATLLASTALTQPAELASDTTLIPAATAVATEAPAEEAAASALDAITAAAEALTATAEISPPILMTSVPVTLEIEFDFVVTQTLTTTVPASVTLQLPDAQTQTLPVAIVIAPLADGEANVEIVLPAALETPEVTPTEAAPTEAATDVTTPTVAATLAPEINGIPLINATANVTANLRAGPGTNFAVVGQVGPGQTVQIAAISEDGGWYLLGGANWIASTLVTEQPANVPVVNDQITQALQGVTPTEEATPTEVTPTEVATPEAPAAAPTTVITPTVTTDANLRAGPGTEFAILGGTVTGQEINIVGRNADGTWFRLDNGGWVFGALVANPPALESIPVVNNDGTPVEATPAPATGLGGLLPTPTPAAPSAPAAQTADLTEYLTAARGLIGQFDLVLNNVDSLLAEVNNNNALITDAAWTTRMNAALRLLSQTSASVGELTVPEAAATVHQLLEDAAISYAEAAASLTQAVRAGNVAQLAEADALISAATASLTAAETAIIQAGGQ